MFKQYTLLLILVGTIFVSGCGQKEIISSVKNQNTTNTSTSESFTNKFVRYIVFSQNVVNGQIINSIFLDKDGVYVNGTNTTQTSKVIMETTPDVSSLETLETPDKKSIVFMVYSSVPMTIMVNTPPEHGPYAGAEEKTFFSYNLADDTITYLFSSDRTQGEDFCLKGFSSDGQALILSCGDGAYTPDGTWGANVYSFANKKLYELGSVWSIEWLADGSFRYKELKEKACDAINYYNCHSGSECETCYRPMTEMPWKYIHYK